MKYLLDTSVITDFVRGHAETTVRIKRALPSDLAISSITLLEIRYGLLLNPQRAKKIANVLDSFLAIIKILAFTDTDAISAATVHLYSHKKNILMDEYDIMLAGVALNNNLILITPNEAVFSDVPKLKIENWRNPLPEEKVETPEPKEESET